MTNATHVQSADWVRTIESGEGYVVPQPEMFRQMLRSMPAYGFYRALSRHVRDGDTVAEAGCGWATSSFVLAERGIHVTAIDIAEQLITGLRGLQSRLGGKIASHLHLIAGDILKAPTVTGCDVVFSDGTYEHFHETETRKLFLQNMHLMLRENGIHAVSVPNLCNPMFRFVADFKMPTMHTFTLRSLAAELEAGGFTVLETGYSFVNPGFSQWLKSPWMRYPMQLFAAAFPYFPRFLQHVCAVHIWCVTRKT
ncbi:class I SAM-dependent methyltransferase [Candidatus Peregrinibacteria bacterium]|nr:class I SAM-dependent methyltransferase [Candidatus Peregrinibacteria bacterium]